MNRGIIQIRINNLCRIPGTTWFTRLRGRYPFAKHLTQDRTIMGQFIRYKQGLVLTAGAQIREHLPGIVQSTPANPERNQQSGGGVNSRPDPRPPVLELKIFGAARTFLFFTKVHSSSSCASVIFNDVRSSESTWAQ